MAQYLLDTDTCIAFLKGKHRLLEKIKRVGFDNCFVSEITIGELLYGAHYSKQKDKHIKEVEKTKQLFKVIPISEALNFFAEEKARLRRTGNLIHDFDLLIGSTAVHFDMIMVTGNEKHLARISGIKIENWIKNDVI